MTSVDRASFVSARSQARSRARRSPRLWKEYKRRRRARPGGRFSLPRWVGWMFWSLMLAVSLPGVLGRVGAASLLAMLALYCSGTAFLRAASLRYRLYSSAELFLALHYPFGDREFFRSQVRRWFISCSPVFVLSAATYLCVAIYGGRSAVRIPSALLGALAQTLMVIALSLSQELWLTRIWTRPALALYALIVCVVSFPKELAPLGGKALGILPATWVNLWFALPETGTRNGVMLVSIGLLAALDSWLVRSLEKGYPRTDVTLVIQQATREQDDEGDAASRPAAQDVRSLGRDYAIAQERFASLRNRTVVADDLSRSEFDWSSGHWTTRVAGRWLTPRQRLVAEFLSAHAIDAWKDTAKRGVQLAAVGAFLCLMPFSVPLWLSLSVFIVAVLTSAPVLGGIWPGLTPARLGSARMQPLVGYPIGYVEASLSIIKVNAVRLLAFTPIELIAGVLVGWRHFDAPAAGLLVSAQIVLTGVAVQPYAIMLLHSAGTNDTARFNGTSVLFACALIANAVLFVLAAFAFFAFNRSLVGWIVGPVVLALLPLSMWRVYGFLYSRRQIDLLPGGTE